ncbi:terminase small subunit [[Clostridium] innocuum]|nr:terminase small subunit [[Clostridium] innocuum]MCR0461722.1 terminase small subunit [[Clostridium] innocuum]
MPRQRSPSRDEAKRMYLDSKGKMLLKDIAKAVGKQDTQIRRWKSLDHWDEELKGNVTILKDNVIKRNNGIEKPPKTELLPEEIETLNNEELTEKQRLFCLYYVKYRNKVKAYQKAFDCSYVNACGHAATLFKKVAIQQAITELLNEMRNEIKLEAKDIILKKMQIAFADITDYVSFGVKTNDAGIEYSYVEFKESSEVDGTIIHEVKRGKDGVSIKLYDSDKALDWLYDHLVITEEQRARINILKSKVPDTNATNFNEQIHSIADLINNPVPERNLNSDTVCTSDDKAE